MNSVSLLSPKTLVKEMAQVKKLQSPHWFIDELGRGERLVKKLKPSPERVLEWLTILHQAWNNAEERAHLMSQWKRLSEWEKFVDSTIKQKNWSILNSWELVLILHNFIALKIVQENLLPKTLDDPSIRFFLFKNIIIFNSLSQLDADHQIDFGISEFSLLSDEDKALAPVLRWSWYFMAGPFAANEIRSRGLKHVGFSAALLLLLMTPERKTNEPLSLFLDSEPDKALMKLQKAVFGTAFPQKGKGLEQDTIGRWGRLLHEAYDNLAGDIAIHTKSIIGRTDPMNALALSLEGRLNFVPRAIDQRNIRSARPKIRTIPVLFGGHELDFDKERDPKWQPEESLYHKELLELVFNDSSLRRLLTVDLATDEMNKMAAALGISSRQLRRLRERIEELLKT